MKFGDDPLVHYSKVFIILTLNKKLPVAEAYLGTCQPSTMELLCANSYEHLAVNYFCSIINILQGPECASRLGGKKQRFSDVFRGTKWQYWEEKS